MGRGVRRGLAGGPGGGHRPEQGQAADTGPGRSKTACARYRQDGLTTREVPQQLRLDGMLIPGSSTEFGQGPKPSPQRGGVDATLGHRWLGVFGPLEPTRSPRYLLTRPGTNGEPEPQIWPIRPAKKFPLDTLPGVGQK